MLDVRLSKESSEAIAFVFASHFAEALCMREINQWAESVLLATDDYPEYILDLCTHKGYLKDVYNLIGFAPVSDLSAEEKEALHGIADMRGVDRFEPFPSKERAKEMLRVNAHVLPRFREQFPFVAV